MKKFVNLVLVVLILSSPFSLGQRVEAKARGKGGRAAAAKAPASKARPRLRTVRMSVAACKTEDYVPGRLIITYSENPQYKSLSRTMDKRLLQKIKNENATDLLESQSKGFGIKNIRPLYSSDYDSLDQFKTKLQTFANNGNNQLEKQRLIRKLRYDSLMQKSPLSRSYILDTELTDCKDLQKLVDKLMKDTSIEKIDVDHILHRSSLSDGNPNDTYFQGAGTTNSFPYSYTDGPMWNIKKIQAPQSWRDSTGKNVIVAVIDSGVDYNHPDLFDNIWVDPNLVSDRDGNGIVDIRDLDANNNRLIDTTEFIDDALGHDYGSGDSNPINDDVVTDSNIAPGHGTHVAGTIAAVGNNNQGVVGVAPEAKIMAVKIFGDSASDTKLADGITYAINHDADVINMSLGVVIPLNRESECSSDTLTYLCIRDERTGFTEYFDFNNQSIKIGDFQGSDVNSFYPSAIAIRNAISGDEGMKIVISAGNDDINVYDGGIITDDRSKTNPVQKISLYPLISGVIGVGASTETDQRASSFSNYGASEYIDIAAPGGASASFSKALSYTKKINFTTKVYGTCTSSLVGDQNHTIDSANILSTVPASTHYQLRGHSYNKSATNVRSYWQGATATPERNLIFNNISYPYTCSSDSLPIFKVGNEPVHSYEVYKGTSMAAPHVTGAVALLLAVKSDLTPAQVRNILVNTGDTINADQPIGPRLNVRRALDVLIVPAPNLINATPGLTTGTASASWSTVTGSSNAGSIRYKYELLKEVNAIYQKTGGKSGTTSNTNISLTNLTNGNYRFQVQACNDYICSAFSNTKDFIIAGPAGTVVLLFPTSSSSPLLIPNSANDMEVPFRWNKPLNATSYIFSLTKDDVERPSETVANTNDSSTTITLTKNLTAGSYKFRVTGVNASGIAGAASAERSFTVSERTDRIKNLSAGETIVGDLKLIGVTPRLTWDLIANALYKVEYTGPNSSSFIRTGVSTNLYSFTEPLAPGDYVFKVSAKLSGQANYGTPSSISVKVINELPAAVIIPSAQFTTVEKISKPVISVRNIDWDSVLTAHSYNTILTKPDLTTVSVPVEQTSLSLDAPLPLGDYSISVAAVNVVGEGLPTIQEFILVPDATDLPGAVVMSSLANETILTNQKPTLDWNQVPTAFAYELSLEKIQPDSKIIETELILSANSYTPADDLELGKYRLKVHAINIEGHGQDTVIEFFIAASSTVAPDSVNIVDPTASKITNSTKPLIKWDAVPGALYYELKIQTASGVTPVDIANLPAVEVYDISYEPSIDLPFNKYQVSIRARNSTAFSTPSIRVFSVVPNPVSFNNIPATIQGFDFSILMKDTIITWTEAVAATTYSITVDGKAVTSGKTYKVTQTSGNHDIVVTPKFSYSDGLPSTLTFTAAPSVTAKPGLVSITAPKANAVFNIATPKFTWTAITGAIKYEITISQSFPVVKEIVVTSTTSLSYTHTSNLSYGNYNIKVRAINALGNGEYGPGTNFKVTGAGIKIAPTGSVTVNGPTGTGNPAIISDLQPTITWNTVGLIDYYELTLLKFDTQTNRYVAVNASPLILNTISYKWPSPLELGYYKVAVKAVNGYGSTTVPADSAKYTFVVANPSLSAPSLTNISISSAISESSPVIISDKRPRIDWQGLPDAIYYDVKVINVSSKAIVGTQLTASPAISYLVNADLTANTLYRVVVTAKNSFGSRESTKDFFLGTAPTLPTLTLTNEITSVRKPKLSWTKPAGTISSYQVLIVNGITGAAVQDPITVAATTTSHTLSSDLVNGFYKFQVRAVHPFGTGPWSIEKKFYVDATSTVKPASSPKITSPTANLVTSSTPQISWDLVPGTVYYTFEINKATNPVKNQFSSTNLYTGVQVYGQTSHVVTASPALSAGTYRVRMYAYNAGGVSAASTTYVNFKVQ